LRLDAERIRTVIADGARAGSSWLRHPLVSRLTKPGPADSYRDLALAAWVAAATRSDLGEVELTEQVLLWSGAGDQVIDAGRHELSALGALMAEPPPVPLALDLWCRATGVVTPGSWPALPPSAIAEREPEIEASIGRYLRTMAVLAGRCPDLMDWITSATTVVRPLVPVDGVARSSHDPEVPGLVEADIAGGPALTIELLVHETAHRHLRMAQANAELIDPAHDGRYRSSLRPDPRPLIGVLLAYHALAYVCVALAEAARAGILPAARNPAVTDLGRRRDDAREVLHSARAHLTDAGADFVFRTDQVACHVFA
jgi:HEXXH motif-containing protein